jgi:ribosome-associated translation inhibitor RaiA
MGFREEGAMGKGSVLDRHVPGGRLNDKGQLEMPNIDEDGTALMVVDQDLPPEAWSRLDELEAKIKAKQNEAASHIAEWLFEARGIWRYHRAEGGFRGWVESRLGYSHMTAYRMIAVHEKLGAESVTLWDTLGPGRALYELSKKDTPEEVVQAVVARAEDGERVSHAEVKRLIAEAKEAASLDSQKKFDELQQQYRRARDSYEAQLAKLHERVAGSVPKDGAQAAIDAAMAPLEKRLREMQDKLKRYEAEKRENGAVKDVLKDRAPLLPYMNRVRSGLGDLTKALTISPEEFLEAAAQLERLNGKPASETLSEPVEHAKVLVAWLERLFSLIER